MLLPPKSGRISMTFTNAFYIETIFEMASNFGGRILKCFSTAFFF